MWSALAWLLGLYLLFRLSKALLRLGAVPRGRALQQSSWRDLCLLRSARLPLWPTLHQDFERCRALRSSAERHRATVRAVEWPSILRVATLRELSGRGELLALIWEAFHFLNGDFFGSELQVDEIRLLEGLEDGAEACVWVDFGDDVRLQVDFDYSLCRAWSGSRMVSVLLHELVHVWHDSNWSEMDLESSHPREFLKKCLELNELCDAASRPFFPNVFTESWSILVPECLDLDATQLRYLRSQEPFGGDLLSDFQALGLSYEEVMRLKRRINAGHIRQALELGYEGLQSWRASAARAFMASHEEILIRSDYALVPLAFLAQVAERHGHDPEVVNPLAAVCVGYEEGHPRGRRAERQSER